MFHLAEYITWVTQLILNAVPCDYVPEEEDEEEEEEGANNVEDKATDKNN